MEAMNCSEISASISQMKKLKGELDYFIKQNDTPSALAKRDEIKKIYNEITDRILFECPSGKKLIGYEYKAIKLLVELNEKYVDPEYAFIYTLERELRQIKEISPEGHIIRYNPNISLHTRDLSPIGKLTKLKELHFTNMRHASDISSFSSLIELEDLEMNCPALKDISPLSNCVKLKRVNINNTSVSDLTPLANLKYFESLYCIDSDVCDISPLRGNKALTSLLIGSHRKDPVFTDLSDIATIPNLSYVVLNKMKTTDFSCLKHLHKLNWLCMYDDNIEKIELSKKAKKLADVRISNCGLKDLSIFSYGQKLRFFEINGNPVTSLDPIVPSSNTIYRMNIENTQINDLSPLLSFKELREVRIKNNPQLQNNAQQREIINQLKAKGVKVEE